MTERSQQERAEQEELMARGPVSRGASNKNAPLDAHAGDQQATDDHTMESTGPDPKHPELQEHSTGSGSASKRDLGTVGGGMIPRTGTGPRVSQTNRGGKGTNEEIIDPMTSRAPDKLGQKASKHTEQKKLTEH